VWNEELQSKIIPKKATNPHPIVLERTGRRIKNQEKIGTSNTAQLASKVAFVTDVSRIEMCQVAKSSANAKPASQTKGDRKGSRADEPSFCRLTNIHRMGTARAILQKAVAIGPVDASRTKIGANPIATAPAASKRNERVIVPYRLQRAPSKRKNFSRSFGKLALAVLRLLKKRRTGGD
jgi:hypothetical protein